MNTCAVKALVAGSLRVQQLWWRQWQGMQPIDTR